MVPLFYYYNTKELTLFILAPLTFIFLIIDIFRIKNVSVKRIYNIFFKSITRVKENVSLTGASYVLIASTLTILLFSKDIAIISLLIMSISDSMAAIFGRKFGTIKVNKKTFEGSIAFFLSSLIIISFFKEIVLPFAFIAIFLTTLIELFLDNINDNLTIPIAFGGIYSILILIFNNSGIS